MSTAKEQLDFIDNLLEEYERKLGLPKIPEELDNSQELEMYLTMDRKHVEALSIEDCSYICMRLAQFAIWIQRAQNREKSRVTWARNRINVATADTLQSYKGYGREEKFWQAVKGDDFASKVHKIQVYAEQRAERLDFISNGLINLSKQIESIKYNKLREEKDG